MTFFLLSFYHEKLEACQSLEDMFVNQAELQKNAPELHYGICSLFGGWTVLKAKSQEISASAAFTTSPLTLWECDTPW